MTLEQTVRRSIGQQGPQLPTEEYYQRIEDVLERMTVGELLNRISMAMEEAGVTFP